jgi:RNA polymerase sigma-70 factor (ECF subfamily)
MIKALPTGQSTSVGSLTLLVAAEATAEDLPAKESADAETRLRAIFREHYDFIWRTLRRLGLEAARADDAAQLVFVTASRKLEQIRVGGERGYLFGIALRVASDARRAFARRRERPLEHAGDAADPRPLAEEALDQQRARALLDEALAKLPLELRVVFVLHELEELAMSEIAELVGIPKGTVASRLRRARQEFETIMARLNRGGAR